MKNTHKALVALFGFVLVVLLLQGRSSALSGSDFKPGRIIDDAVFTNKSSMDVNQIQRFLESKVAGGSCDTNGSRPSTRWNSAANRYYTHAEWGALNGNPAPFVCLTTYRENPTTKQSNFGNPSLLVPGDGSQSAAEIIYNAAQQYNINPQALMVLLQKEQSLVTDDWPWRDQYTAATGAYCPDTAACDPSKAGFGTQVREAARLFRYYMDTPWLYFVGNNYVLYNPNRACGGTQVNIENRATAALYHYTPYQPNAAALANLYGTGDSCSAYGNRNFWRLFNDWFGSIIGSNYAWNIESFTYSGGDNAIPVGETETLTLRARNIGVVPWYNHGANPVRLATWEPADRKSSLFLTNRLSNVQESVVMPGEIGTFIFQVTPQTPGTFYESLNLVSENNAFAEWPGFRPTINVPKPYEWAIQNVIYEKGTGLMDPGESQLITVIAKNTGSATWAKSNGTPIRMGTWQPQRNSSVVKNWLSNTRAVEMNESIVAPGQNAGFQFYVRMPGIGAFYERLNLVAEGQAWFNDNGLTLYLFGNDYKWSIESVTYSNGTGVMPTGSSQVITLKARNTGTTTWTKNGDFPIKLGTWQPQRQSGVSQSWPSSTRMATLSENLVAPGQIGTFTSSVTLPSVGLFYERMNLVAEGLKWFNDPGLTFYLEAR